MILDGSMPSLNDDLIQVSRRLNIRKIGAPRKWDERLEKRLAFFVDFSTAEEADRAAKAKNGTQAWGVTIRVERARPRRTEKR